MLVTLWAFIGIEGAVVMSKRAKKQSDVGKATILGFIGCLIIYILLSLLPYGFMSQEELASIANPSTAGILEKVIGKSGAWLMNIGLFVSVLSSWLAWTMITAEIPQAAAENGTFPKLFIKENSNNSPSASLWITSGAMQFFLLMAYFSSNAWNTMLSITGVMVLPAYFMSCAYLWKLCEDGEFSSSTIKRSTALITSIIGAFYALWLIYAAGLKYLLLATIIIALGIPFYVRARKENYPDECVFTEHEWALASLFIIISLAALYAFLRGIITI
jgi:arginine:ornithine antiporter/lysine permease